MKKALLLFITFVLIFGEYKTQTWSQLTDFPGLKRDDGVAFVNGNIAYCGTGLIEWAATRDFYALDLTTETWSTVASLPVGKERQYACTFGRGLTYVFGGEAGGNDFNDLWQYSTATNSWTALTSKPGNGVRGATGFWTSSAQMFVVGGTYSTNVAINEVWAYGIMSDVWTQKNNLPFTCWRGSSAEDGTYGYLLFGKEASGRYRKELMKYDLSLDSWTQISTFPGPGRTYATMQVINNTNLIVFGGMDSLNNYYNDLWKYDLTNNTWTQLISLPSFGRKGGMGFVNNNIFYYTCGINQSNTRLTETWKAAQLVGIEEDNEITKVKIFSNPVTEFIGVINYHMLPSQDYQIYDINGKKCASGMMEKGSIDIASLSNGLYFLYLNGFNAKIVKQ